ncbi:polysaccharide pyruvyl transferase family protein [Halorubrum sp. DTA98]|uniref:polysaccharide pyruvyl transferase family protein n=1 Tax=Halorubrum sp. DTA98 TaxID=3402163 RepID=UPI003AAC7765
MSSFNKAREIIAGTPAEKPAQALVDAYRIATHYPVNKRYARNHSDLRNKEKIIYGITPPARLRNIGDHAQAVAIHNWISEHFEEYSVHEMDKDHSYRYIDGLKSVTSPDDPIFLHSGGNMGDRGMWSEQARRKYIEKFQNNTIVSLPQTIYFSDTNEGQKQLQKSKSIYNSHPDLTIVARDEYSYEFAQEHFHECNVLVAPDFVLSLIYDLDVDRERDVLLCLRRDEESILSERDQGQIEKQFEENEVDYLNYDTTLSDPILKDEREETLKENLKFFSESEVVVTDRFHGIIFSVVTGRPCVALKTVDHKIPESIKWFSDLPQVRLASDLEEVVELVETLRQVERRTIDWNERYFQPLAEDVKQRL